MWTFVWACNHYSLTACTFNFSFVLNTVYTASKSSVIVRPSLFCLFILHYRTLDFMHIYLFFDLVRCQNCFKNIPLKTSFRRPCRCLVIYFYNTLLHRHLKFTASLNQVCRVRSMIVKFFVRFCVSRRPAIHKHCCQVTNFVQARSHGGERGCRRPPWSQVVSNIV